MPYSAAVSTTLLPSARRRRPTRIVATAIVLGAILTAVVYYVARPVPLVLDTAEVTASVPAGQSVYVGVYATGADFGRTLHLSGVRVHTTSTSELTVVPLLCRNGSVSVTVAPRGMCEELVDPQGQDLTSGDEIVLQVTGSTAAQAVIDPVRLVFREGLRWGYLPAGAAAIVRVLPV